MHIKTVAGQITSFWLIKKELDFYWLIPHWAHFSVMNEPSAVLITPHNILRDSCFILYALSK
jgi:hypothetical protein